MKKLMRLGFALAFFSYTTSLTAQSFPTINWDFVKMTAFFKAKKEEPNKCAGVVSNVISITVVKCTEEVADNRKKEKIVQ
jgi:hypothetical protein